MNLPRSRHDTLFRLLVSDREHASTLLLDHLPRAIAHRFDARSPPEHVEGAAVDGEGVATRRDAVFRVRLVGGAIVYVLLERKSYVDRRAPLQILRYTLPLWLAKMDRGEHPSGMLPLVVPLVFYHGKSRWKALRTVGGMIDIPEGLEGLAGGCGH